MKITFEQMPVNFSFWDLDIVELLDLAALEVVKKKGRAITSVTTSTECKIGDNVIVVVSDFNGMTLTEDQMLKICKLIERFVRSHKFNVRQLTGVEVDLEQEMVVRFELDEGEAVFRNAAVIK